MMRLDIRLPRPLLFQNRIQRSQGIRPRSARHSLWCTLCSSIWTRDTLWIPESVLRIVLALDLLQPRHISAPVRRERVPQFTVDVAGISAIVDARDELLDVRIQAVEEAVGGLGDGANEIEDVGLHEVDGVAVPVGCGGLGDIGDAAAVEVPNDEVEEGAFIGRVDVLEDGVNDGVGPHGLGSYSTRERWSAEHLVDWKVG